MKKLLSIVICSVLLLSLFAMTSLATPKITLDEAEDLIRQMVDYKYTVLGDIKDSEYIIDIQNFRGEPVTDKAVLKALRKETGIDESHVGIIFYELQGEYGKASFWFDRLRNFLTDKYVEENLKLDYALVQVGENAYTVSSIAYDLAPGYPTLAYGKSISDCITFIDDDTVMFEASYNDEDTKRQIDFEYTENGWRISGGKGAKSFLRYAWKNSNVQNPETGDGVTVIIACLAVSMLGVGLTVKKRRYTNIA